MNHPRPASNIQALHPGLAMDQWKHAIARGNGAFDIHDNAAALGHYRLATVLALDMFDTWPDHDAAVAAFVVAHHNLADLHLREARVDEAADLLCRAHERLQATIADTRLELPLRRTALRHSRQTYTELLHFSQKHEGHPQVSAILARGNHGFGSSAAAEYPLH
jgi:hypothetical protein